MEVELIADYACVVGEGPLWHPDEGRLYWADIPTGRMFRYDPAAESHEQFYDGDLVGGFTIQADGSLLLFMARGAIASWRDGELSYLVEGLPGEEENRFNDVFADVKGRVFCGTMPQDSSRGAERLGTLYRLDTDLAITPVAHDIGISNGMGLTPDRKGLYYTDTTDDQVHIFDYDQETGQIRNRRVFVDSTKEVGFPDGMTVDAEGCVWSARWEGSCVVRYSPEGEEIGRVSLPTPRVTSAIFGGADYSDMYITTAGGEDKAQNGASAGALFRATPGVGGVPEYRSRIGL